VTILFVKRDDCAARARATDDDSLNLAKYGRLQKVPGYDGCVRPRFCMRIDDQLRTVAAPHPSSGGFTR
jgi:hypothetical protein